MIHSDCVLAIVIAIMVLVIKVPHEVGLRSPRMTLHGRQRTDPPGHAGQPLLW